MSISKSLGIGIYHKPTAADLERFGWVKHPLRDNVYCKKSESENCSLVPVARIYSSEDDNTLHIYINLRRVNINTLEMLSYAIKLIGGDYKNQNERNKLISKIKNLEKSQFD